MNYKMIARLVGLVLLIEACLLIAPLVTAIVYSESVLPYVITMAALVAASAPVLLLKPKSATIYSKDGFVTVAVIWIALSLFGALPFVLSGAIPNYIDALFETVSGFTTTGASILTSVEHLPRGILFWRSFAHWIGGMGVLVFMLAILPMSGGGAIYLMRAEVPGPQKGKLVPKIKETAIILYSIYMFFTVLEVFLLLSTGMPLYDSVINALGTMGTGGFSVLNNSIAGYNNPAAEWIIAIFLLISGINYNLYYFIIARKLGGVLKNEELRTYLIIILAATAIISVNVWCNVENSFPAVSDCIRAAFFQVTSIISTAGFSTVDFNLWPELSKGILVLLMFFGACAGSTAGGLKLSRLIIIVKATRREIKKILKPNSVSAIRLDGEALPETTVRSAVNYLPLYFSIMAVSALLISLDGLDFATNTTAVISCFNNIGPGLSLVGPAGNYSVFSYFSKIVLTLNMIFGRLEIIPMIVLLSPSTWRKRI